MLSPRLTGKTDTSAMNQSHLLSPQSPDMAISSFNSFHSTVRSSGQEARPRPRPQYPPPESVQSLQAHRDRIGFAPLSHSHMVTAPTTAAGGDSGDELFAKALSPRTPDLPRSPFSFAPHKMVACLASGSQGGSMAQ